MPGGSLAVAEGDQIVPVINKIQSKFDEVIWTEDWHPINHSSFKENGGIWPTHCVEGTIGAKIHDDLISYHNGKHGVPVILKGTDIAIDSYSAFWDNRKKKSTGLTKMLRDMNVNRVYISGLATDYCIKFTAIDSVNEGFKTFVIIDACKGVNIKLNDSINAIVEMINKNIQIVTSSMILNSDFGV
jgi:nicotinamidase/pyrazinamidase